MTVNISQRVKSSARSIFIATLAATAGTITISRTPRTTALPPGRPGGSSQPTTTVASGPHQISP